MFYGIMLNVMLNSKHKPARLKLDVLATVSSLLLPLQTKGNDIEQSGYYTPLLMTSVGDNVDEKCAARNHLP